MTLTKKVFVIDPDGAARERLAKLAEKLSLPVSTFATAGEYLAGRKAVDLGCVVVEFRLRDMNSMDLLQQLSGEALAVIFVGKTPDTAEVVKAMQGGAATVLEKPYDEEEMSEAIRESMRLCEQFRSLLLRQKEIEALLKRLTDKERQVMELVAAGRANKQMASELDISTRTVEARRHQVFKKTKTWGVARLVTLLVEREQLGLKLARRWQGFQSAV